MIKYIALLRGINISGKNKISMPLLKHKFEELGFASVLTCLNSGNVIFTSDEKDKDYLGKIITNMIKTNFNLDIPVFVISYIELKELYDNKPSWWGTSNKEIYDNIIFVIPPYTSSKVIKELGNINNIFERSESYKNNIFWSYELKNYRKSNWWINSAKKSVRDYITIRTANTIRKILEISSN